MGSDPQYTSYPDLTLSQDIFNLANSACPSALRQGSLKKLQSAISEHHLAPLYRHLAHPVEGILNVSGEGVPQQPTATVSSTNTAGSSKSNTNKPSVSSNLLPNRKPPTDIDLPWDEKLYDSLVAENNKELEALQKEEDDAGEAAGDTEVQAARGKRAEFWARVGDKVRSSSSYRVDMTRFLLECVCVC